MKRRPPRTNRTGTLLPYTTLFRYLLGDERRAHLGGAERGAPLGEGQVGDLAVGRVGEEGVERRLQAEEHPRRAVGDLRDDPATSGAIDLGRGDRFAPGVGRVAGLSERVGGGDAGAVDEVDQPLAVGGASLVVGDRLEDAVTSAPHRLTESDQLLGHPVARTAARWGT